MRQLEQKLFGNNREKIKENKEITKELSVLTAYLNQHPNDKEIKSRADKLREKLKINNILMG